LAPHLAASPALERYAAQREALISTVSAAAEEFTSARGMQGGGCKVSASPVPEPQPGGSIAARITLESAAAAALPVTIFASPDLASSLGVQEVQKVEAGQGTAEAAQPSGAGADSAADDAMNLDLVMDVELDVTLRFGQRRLTLREVLELTSGSVVELDRHVEEPVELLLDGKVIARGEAVVVDGNYGVRILEVLQPLSVLRRTA
jgi:flagellar motor switch protein FliN/FliY